MNWRLALLPLAFGATYSAREPVHFAQGQQPAQLSRDTLERWIARASNAGRWGKDDELGTLVNNG